MTLDEYQRAAARTMEGGEGKGDLRLAIFALGVAGEAGEVADLMKKWVGHGKPRDMDAMAKELGDVLWYLSAICSDLGLSLRDVAQANINKLMKRYPEGFSYEAANAPREPSSSHPHHDCGGCGGRGWVTNDAGRTRDPCPMFPTLRSRDP